MSADRPSAPAGQPFRPPVRGLRIGRIATVPVYLTLPWFLIAGVVTVFFAPVVRRSADLPTPTVYLVAFSFAVLLLLSVLVHELTHAVLGAWTGNPASHVVLDVWGGHTAFEGGAERPWAQVLVAAGGPLSNALIALLAAVAAAATEPGVTRLLLDATAFANVYVAVFNALPGLPLDGGRVVAGVIWALTGDRARGTWLAGALGRVLAVGCALGVTWLLVGRQLSVLGAIWLWAVSALLWQGAGGALTLARWQHRSAHLRLAQVMRTAVAVPSTQTVAGALLTAAEADARAIVVLDVYGRPAAVVDPVAATQVPLGRTREVLARQVAVPLTTDATLSADLAGEQLLTAMQAAPSACYVVVADQQVVGVLDWDEVATFVSAARTAEAPAQHA